MKKKEIVLIAVVISVFIAFFLDLITPDIWLLLYLKGYEPQLLFKLGIFAIMVAFLIAILLRYHKKVGL